MAKEHLAKYQFNSDQSRIEAAENGRKGGIASGEARREKANLKKQLQIFLEEDIADKHGNVMTGAEMMVKVAVKEMSKGNPKFWELIRDTAGFKPIDKIQVTEIDQQAIDEVEAMVLGAEEEHANTQPSD
jgi:hypothetical protein